MNDNKTARLEMRIRPGDKAKIMKAAKRSGLSVELGKMRDEGLLDFRKSHFVLKV